MAASPPSAGTPRDTSIETYRRKRDFTASPEPDAAPVREAARHLPIFVVQKHAARRLHWDFRLEYEGVLWSWAVPKGPSLDPHDKRLAVHVEDHPLDYAEFTGTIPEGHYGAGTVELWDRGTWEPVGDAGDSMRRGEIKFTLAGKRLRGRFVLVRLKPRDKDRAENWLLIKEHDDEERAGADAGALEQMPAPTPTRPPAVWSDKAHAAAEADAAPAEGARRAVLPEAQAPQLASLADEPPEGDAWLNEVKFDGYRFLAFVEDGAVRLVTRNAQDWTSRLPAVARALGRMKLGSALLDGEVVALRADGLSSFADLQAALSEGRDSKLFFYLFDILHLEGWDLRPCRLADRKRLLGALSDWKGSIRYSDHLEGEAARVRRQACELGLEGIICKRADAPYRPGRSKDWLKVKCQGREEFVILAWTKPDGSRTGIGSLHLGFHDEQQRLHYVGGVGTGFSEKELAALRRKLDALKADAPEHLVYAGEPPERGLIWVRPELVCEVQFVGWSGSGRLRHAVYLGLREDKPAREVVRDVPDVDVPRVELGQRRGASRIVQASRKPAPRRGGEGAPTKEPPGRGAASTTRIVIAKPPQHGADLLEGVRLTHPDRELWPGISKRALAEYWLAVGGGVLPEVARRPLAIVRCPEGVAGEHFFQKHGKPGMAAEIHAAEADGAPYLFIENIAGLVACAQIAAIELHSWGSHLPDPLHADRLVFDLDPGEGVDFAEVARTANEMRERLKGIGLVAFCRTSGGKGLHVVVPLRAEADWDTTRAFCRGFAEAMEQEMPDRYVASVPKVKRRGRILVDWLRNGLGSTAVASYCPRARPHATVATPLDWKEVNAKLDPARFTLGTLPERLKRQRRDPWDGIFGIDQMFQAPAGGGTSRRRR